MFKLTDNLIKFVVDNFDERGELIHPGECIRDTLQQVINTGHVWSKYCCYQKTTIYYCSDYLFTFIASKSYSKLLQTNVRACI